MMKRNLLILVFVCSFFCLGLFVKDVKASTDFSKETQNFGVKRSKSIRTSEFNRKYADLEQLCINSRRLTCNQAILIADAAAAAAWLLCYADPSSCADYQDGALRTLDWAMEVCRNSPENAVINKSIEERKANINREVVSVLLSKKQSLRH